MNSQPTASSHWNPVSQRAHADLPPDEWPACQTLTVQCYTNSYPDRLYWVISLICLPARQCFISVSVMNYPDFENPHARWIFMQLCLLARMNLPFGGAFRMACTVQDQQELHECRTFRSAQTPTMELCGSWAPSHLSVVCPNPTHITQ